MTDTRRDVAERLDQVRLQTWLTIGQHGVIEDAIRLLRSEGREPDAWLVECLTANGEWVVHTAELDPWIPDSTRYRRTPLYRGTPSDSPTEPSVKMPETEDEAALMAIMGERWLRDNAPHRLRASDSPEREDGETTPPPNIEMRTGIRAPERKPPPPPPSPDLPRPSRYTNPKLNDPGYTRWWQRVGEWLAARGTE